VILLRLCRNTLPRLLVALVIISSLAASPAYSQETEDSQVFIAGFNAYQRKDYASSIEKMSEVLQKHPDTPLRDMALFWLSRSYYKAGNQREAARYLSQFSKEYPDNPLRNTAESDLLSLTARYESGEELPTGLPLPKLAAVPDAKALAAAKKQEAEMAAEAARKQTEQKAAAEKKELEQVAATRAEQVRIAQAAAAREKAEQQRIAAINSASERKAAEQAAAAKIELDRLAAAKAEEALRVEVEAETARINAQKVEAARLARIQAEKNRIAIAKAAEARLTEQRVAEENDRAAKLAYREKAISQYKTIIDKFPTSRAAVTAVTKLRELGVAVALPVQTAEAPAAAENAQILRFEVAQFAGFEFNLLPRPDTFTVGRAMTVPFEVINRGNGNDSFYLESAFPADFKTRFASAAAPAVAISQTPELVPGEAFKGIIELVIPPGSIDGLRITHPVKAASRLLAEASQSREVQLTASAPLLRAVVRTEKTKLLPGDKPVYRIAILNVGSTAAQDVTFRLNFPPQFEPVDYAASGFRQEMKSALVLDGLQLKSGESREFSVTLQLKDDSLAGQELSTRAELINNQLKTTAAFISNLSYVDSRRGISVRTGANNLVAIPGQTVNVPFVLTNSGNTREKFKVSHVVTGAQGATAFNDLNRDGIHQAGEPEISEIGPLAPREEAGILIEIKTPATAADGSSGSVQIYFVTEGDTNISATGTISLTYSRPLLKMIMTGLNGRLKPGDVASFDLTVTNSGSNLARIVELQSAWPEQLELVAAEPAASAVSNGAVVWRFKELGAGEKRSIKVSFRVKPGIGVGTAIQVKNILSYEDQLGNRY